ncbi:MAG: hypothetical protein KAH91_05405, partial [Thermoplasmatales archaeon]|nr:hypothetical protein [Thermoplasmatales archaeon]
FFPFFFTTFLSIHALHANIQHANTFHVYCSQVTIYKANPVVFQNGKKAGAEKSQNDIFTKLGRH